MPVKKLDFLLSVLLPGKIVARKLLTQLGLNEVMLAGSGSTPIPTALIAWHRRLGLNLMDGYATTKDFAKSNTTPSAAKARWHVGVAFPGVKRRVSTDGEILIKSLGTLMRC